MLSIVAFNPFGSKAHISTAPKPALAITGLLMNFHISPNTSCGLFGCESEVLFPVVFVSVLFVSVSMSFILYGNSLYNNCFTVTTRCYLHSFFFEVGRLFSKTSANEQMLSVRLFHFPDRKSVV